MSEKYVKFYAPLDEHSDWVNVAAKQGFPSLNAWVRSLCREAVAKHKASKGKTKALPVKPDEAQIIDLHQRGFTSQMISAKTQLPYAHVRKVLNGRISVA